MTASLKTFILLFIVAFFFCGLTLQQKQNNPPDVKLSLGEKTKFLRWKSLVTYSISVSDVEDGKSEYNEIPSNEVLLEVRFFSDSSLARKVVSSKAANQDVPLQMGKALCFSCHGVKTKVIGPSFEQIAKRYKGISSAEDSLSGRIIRGSTGIWSEVKMPPHPDLTKEEVLKIVRWILQNGDDPDLNYFAGLQGAFRTKERPADAEHSGAYMLTATYADHGPDLKQGRSIIVVGIR